jgi:transposase
MIFISFLFLEFVVVQSFSIIFESKIKIGMKLHLSVLLILLSFLALGQTTNSENTEVAFGPMFTVDKRSVPTKFVGSDESGFYVVYSNGKNGTGDESLHKFGYDLNPIKDSQLAVSVDGDMVFMLDNKLYQIVRTNNGNSTDDQTIIERESWWKEVLQSRQFGYNEN